ncbi:hypothetical protein V1477_004479 [Vespula maculifrons]|uniref:Uncharacterized protein n=1 Tax=Vespula maculifrons TaxID=7453 RepID=A0ABD2CRS2_VESMC
MPQFNSSNRITAETNLGYNSLEILKILLFGSIDITSSIIYRYDIDGNNSYIICITFLEMLPINSSNRSTYETSLG